MKKTLFLFLLFAVLAPTANSQQSTANSQQSASARELDERTANGLSLLVDAEGFFYDAEYGTPFAKGFTVCGFRLSPTLVYDINERAQLHLGFNAMMFAGLDSLYMLRPTMTLLYKPAPWLTLVAGTLLNGERRTENGERETLHPYTLTPLHQLPAPVIDPVRHIFNYQEDGIQILTDTRIWRSDTWLDWTHYLVPWTPDQELFTMGTKHEMKLFERSMVYYERDYEDTLPPFFVSYKGQRISVPCHFMASHRGGEVKTIDTNTVTTFNENVGLRFLYSFSHNEKNCNDFVLDLPIYFYHLDNKVDHGGKAFYPSISYCWSRLNPNSQFSIFNSQFSIFTSLGFWHGDHYFSAMGSPLFWSINHYSLQHIPFTTSQLHNFTTTNPDLRNLLTYTLSIEHTFKDIALGLKMDAIHDIDLKTNDFIFSFFLNYNGIFKIK